MSFALTSRITLGAQIKQYTINDNGPVNLTLYGSESYCDLKAVQNPQLKEVLAKVGAAFEEKAGWNFFNVDHTFTPTEATDNKSSEDNEDLDNRAQVKGIFAFVKAAIAGQTNGMMALDLTDVTRLDVHKAEDRHGVIRRHEHRLAPHRTFELGVRISEKATEAAEKSGLIFREYAKAASADSTAFALGVGQTSLW